MRLRTLIILSAAVAGLLAFGRGPVWAQEDVPVQVDLVADKTDLTVGDRVSMTLDVTYPSGFQVVLPRLPRKWGALEVLDQSRSSTVDNGDGTATISQVIEVTLFTPGTFQTPDLEISVREPGGDFNKKTVPPVSLVVASVLSEGDDKLRDIRPQASLDVPPLWPWALGGLVLMALLGAVIYLAVRRRRKRAAAAPVIDLRTPYEIAVDELYRIEELDLPGQSRFKEHYALVAAALRAYLEGEYQIRALDRTTAELRTALSLAPIGVPGTREVVAFLTDCDLVKFTKLRPSTATARETPGEARRLLDKIRPAPEAVRGTGDLAAEAPTA